MKTLIRLATILLLALLVSCGAARQLTKYHCTWWQRFQYDAKNIQLLGVIDLEWIDNEITDNPDAQLVAALRDLKESYKQGDILMEYVQSIDGERWYGYLLIRHCQLIKQAPIERYYDVAAFYWHDHESP